VTEATMNGQPPQPSPAAIEADVARVRNAQLDGAEILARKAAGASSGAEAKDFAAASMSLAQAVVILDPSLDQQGIPLQHQKELEQQRLDGQERLEKARQAASKPSPKKRVTKRDSTGKATASYEVEG
jgi:hypothetical protein